MVKKKQKKTLTLDEKIKAVLVEDQMKQPVKPEKIEEMEVDDDEDEDDVVDDLGIGIEIFTAKIGGVSNVKYVVPISFILFLKRISLFAF